MYIQEIIIETAIKYVGQREKPPNVGFIDSKFQELMEIVGWNPSYAWCALFAELVWKESYSKYDSTIINELDELFSAGSVQTFLNFSHNKSWEINNKPIPGSLVTWQNYKNNKPLWTGHTGIVIQVDEQNGIMETVEGNTNDSGSREGEGVYLKTRSWLNQSDNFRIKGFIYPKQ